MIKKLLFSAALFAGTLLTYAQVSVQLLAYPTEFGLVSGTTYGPSTGQSACIFQVNNMPTGSLLYSPIMPVATLNTRNPQATGQTGTGNGAGSIGTCLGLHSYTINDGSSSRILNYVDNGDGTASYTIVATRFTINNTPDEVTEYAPNFRVFGQIFFSPVKEVSGNIEVAGMVFNSGATVETEANLLAGAATLSFKSNQASIASSLYPNPVSDVLTVNVQGAQTYRLINTVGQTVLEQQATGSINVSSLASGVYILVTEVGTAKVVVK